MLEVIELSAFEKLRQEDEEFKVCDIVSFRSESLGYIERAYLIHVHLDYVYLQPKVVTVG